jgi:predicted TIM-barrel fold metal-dependent hydrolase
VIVDAHTHIFPPDLIRGRDDLAVRDPAFAELYADPRAKLATAEDLLQAMDGAGVDRAVITGFAWRDPGICREHNEYLLRMSDASGGRLAAFCTLPLVDIEAARREATYAAGNGARGFGELRPESQHCSIADGETAGLLSWVWETTGLPLLLHASEPVGHHYAGKTGGPLAPLYAFTSQHRNVRLIAAHWGGGLPFYALMPEVRESLANVWVDTAATTLLYEPAVFRVVVDLIGAEKVLFGSDFPLLSPKTQLKAIAGAPLTPVERTAITGESAASLFELHG